MTVIRAWAVIECKDLTAADVNGLLASHWLHFNQFGIAGYSDPFVVVKMADDKAQQKTKVCEKNLNPVFNTDFTLCATQHFATFRFLSECDPWLVLSAPALRVAR